MYSSFYEANFGESGMVAADLSYSATYDKAFIIIKSDSGFSKIEFDPTTETFSSSLWLKDRLTFFVRERNGFTYIGGNILSSGANFISKLVGNGDNSQNQNVVMVTSASTFTAAAGISLIVDPVMTVSAASNPGSSTTAYTFTSPGVYTTSVVDVYSSDIIYQGGFSETLYVQESYSGYVPLSYPCSISGGTAVTSSIIPHPVTFTMPAWVAISTGWDLFSVTAPTVTSGTTYYFGVRSVILGENVDKSVTLVLYQCSDPA